MVEPAVPITMRGANPLLPTCPGIRLMKSVLLATVRVPGPPIGEVVPMPTFPPFVTMKLVAVDEPITKEGPEMPFGFTERKPHGEEVPTPRKPVEVMVVVPV